ncbi:hypothetical protein [Aliarcobacter butzleri]|uniref:hypothetical protein n=1 Tax=Aliarcobacter butzleri TaxID=28197 RepID=UPI0015879C16|nr:hypothetical protein [Aliarcobacter butzleri]NUW28974.1 hypothetical protein [Aliarcobacter butzleri]
MKKILLLLIILFSSLVFAVDEKHEKLAQKANTCAAYFATTAICFNNTKGSENLALQSYTLYESFLDISKYYYKKSIPTRSNKMLENLAVLNSTNEAEDMMKNMENDCGNISIIIIPHGKSCVAFYKEAVNEKIVK